MKQWLPLANGWFGELYYQVLPDGTVLLSGQFTGDGVTYNKHVAQLPPKYSPTTKYSIPINNQGDILSVDVNGLISVELPSAYVAPHDSVTITLKQDAIPGEFAPEESAPEETLLEEEVACLDEDPEDGAVPMRCHVCGIRCFLPAKQVHLFAKDPMPKPVCYECRMTRGVSNLTEHFKAMEVVTNDAKDKWINYVLETLGTPTKT